jgi:hypothetical protein
VAEGEKKEQVMPLYSFEERRDIVKGFLDAYQYGFVKIAFPDKVDLAACQEMQKFLKQAEVNDPELFSKDLFSEQIKIATGLQSASSTEMEVSINWLFGYIFNLRMGGRLQGEFSSRPKLEERFTSLEERVANIERSLEELRHRLRIQGE